MSDDAVYLAPGDAFPLLADTYDARLSGDPLLLLESTATLAALPQIDGARVADLGCGTGRYALQMGRLGAAEVVGLDLCPEMLAVARRKARRAGIPIRWGVADLDEPLPLDPESVDVAVCALTLSYLPDPAPALRHVARVLRPGGALVCSDRHPHGLLAARAASAAAFRRDRAPFLRFTDHEGRECRVAQTPHPLSALFDAARAAGLTLERIAEPAVDHRLAATYAGLDAQIGLPLALVLRLRKA